MCILASDIKGAPHWSSQCDTNASFLSLPTVLTPYFLTLLPLSFTSSLLLYYCTCVCRSFPPLPSFYTFLLISLPCLLDYHFGLTTAALCPIFPLHMTNVFSSFFLSLTVSSPLSLSSCLRENKQFFWKTGVWAHSRNIIFGIRSSSRLVSQCLPPHAPKKGCSRRGRMCVPVYKPEHASCNPTTSLPLSWFVSEGKNKKDKEEEVNWCV